MAGAVVPAIAAGLGASALNRVNQQQTLLGNQRSGIGALLSGQFDAKQAGLDPNTGIVWNQGRPEDRSAKMMSLFKADPTLAQAYVKQTYDTMNPGPLTKEDFITGPFGALNVRTQGVVNGTAPKTAFDNAAAAAGLLPGMPGYADAAYRNLNKETYFEGGDPTKIALTKAQTESANANAVQSYAGAAKDKAEAEKLAHPDIAAQYKQLFGNDVPSGFTPVVDANGKPTGAVAPMVGGPSDPSKQPSRFNNDQNKAAGFANTMTDAEERLSRIGDGKFGEKNFKQYDPTAFWESTKGQTNVTASPKYQKYKQAALDWTLAVLRQESGANVPEVEAEKYWKNFFPQYGDSKEVIAQKNASRASKMRGVVAASGGAFDALRKNASKPGPSATPNDPPSGIDPNIWAHMTDEEKALFNG